MKRNALIKLVPATNIIVGEVYVGCLHGESCLDKAFIVTICEEQTYDNTDTSEKNCYDCRFLNGNIYPFMEDKLFVFVAEYEVASLANPKKSVGTNIIELDRCDYHTQLSNKNVVNTRNRVEVGIDFERNVAKVMSTDKTFTLKEVLTILEDLKSHDDGKLSSMGEYARNIIMDGHIEEKIQSLKKKYEYGE